MPNIQECLKQNASNQAGDELLQRILIDFSKSKKNPESRKKLGEKAWRLILNFRLEQVGAKNASQAIKDKIIADATALALSWDTDDASLSTVQKIFNRLAAGRFEEAIKLAESSITNEFSKTQKALQNSAKNAVKKRHEENNKIIEDAIAYYKKNIKAYSGYGGKKKAAYDLERLFPPISNATYKQHLKKIK
jgi:fructose-specific phosphotransferase system component IIB